MSATAQGFCGRASDKRGITRRSRPGPLKYSTRNKCEFLANRTGSASGRCDARRRVRRSASTASRSQRGSTPVMAAKNNIYLWASTWRPEYLYAKRARHSGARRAPWRESNCSYKTFIRLRGPNLHRRSISRPWAGYTWVRAKTPVEGGNDVVSPLRRHHSIARHYPGQKCACAKTIWFSHEAASFTRPTLSPKAVRLRGNVVFP